MISKFLGNKVEEGKTSSTGRKYNTSYWSRRCLFIYDEEFYYTKLDLLLKIWGKKL